MIRSSKEQMERVLSSAISRLDRHIPSAGTDRRRFLTLLLGATAGLTFFEIPMPALGQQQGPSGDFSWVCPMHADYTSDVPGVCAFCGMTLVYVAPFDVRDYRLDFRTVPASAKAGENTTMTFK